ncbi:MAG: hypothetical protein Q4D25_02595, partial [Bacteroidales bacterium]|nr:hypothetical protein [Bacteroidales bacterium]
RSQQEQKPSLLGLCLARRKKAKPIDTTQIFHGFILWKEEKVVPLRYLNLKSKYDFNYQNI